jgi:hypothetical protein
VSYCVGVKGGVKEDFDFVKGKYTASPAPDKPRIVSALACSKDTALLQNYLKDSISMTSIIQGRQVFSAVCTNPLGVDLALRFLLANWYPAANL